MNEFLRQMLEVVREKWWHYVVIGGLVYLILRKR